MTEFLVQIQVKKPSGKVHLLSILTTTAKNIETAYSDNVSLAAETGEIVDGFATSDPYEIGEWVCRTRLPADIVHMTVTD